MICVECGNDEVCDGYELCSDCLEFISGIRVWRDTHWGDWVMYCYTHEERGTYESWAMAYEAAVGHACMGHPVSSVCFRRGHNWERKYPGHRSDLYQCRRCEEPGWQIFEDLGPVAVDQSWADAAS